MYEPLHLPAIRRKPRRKSSSDTKQNVNMDLSAIRARRQRLEALTMAMRTQPPPQIPRKNARAAFSANKMRRSSSVGSGGSGGSAGHSVRLQPLENRSPPPGSIDSDNLIDRHRAMDPLLRSNSSKEGMERTPRPATGGGTETATLQEAEDAEDFDDGLVLPKTSINVLSTPKMSKKNVRVSESPRITRGDLEDHSSTVVDVGVSRSSKAVTKEMKGLVHSLESSDEGEQLKAVTKIRTRVSAPPDPPIDPFIEAHGLPPLIALLKPKYDHNADLQTEALWALTNIAAGTSSNTMDVIDAGGIPPIKRLLAASDEKVSMQALWAMSNIVGDSKETRDKALEAGVLHSIVQMIYRYTSAEAQRILAWTLSNLVRFRPFNMSPEDLTVTIKALEHYLTVDEDSARVDAVRGFEFITNGNDSDIQEVLDSGVMPTIVDYLEDPDSRLVQTSLKTVGNILSGNDKQTDALIHEGALPLLVKLLHDDDPLIQKEAAWALSNVMAGTPKQILAVLECNALPIYVTILNKLKCDEAVGREVCWCIGNACSGGGQDVVDEIVLTNCFPVLMNYFRRCPNDSQVQGLVLTACIDMLEHTTKLEHLKKTVAVQETEDFITAQVGRHNQQANTLLREIKTKLRTNDAESN